MVFCTMSVLTITPDHSWPFLSLRMVGSSSETATAGSSEELPSTKTVLLLSALVALLAANPSRAAFFSAVFNFVAAVEVFPN
jgi:hypothetical protein